MASLDDLESAIGQIGVIDGNEDREMLDIFHVCVCRAIEVWREASRTSELVVD